GLVRRCGVSDLRSLRTAPCARRSRGPTQISTTSEGGRSPSSDAIVTKDGGSQSGGKHSTVATRAAGTKLPGLLQRRHASRNWRADPSDTAFGTPSGCLPAFPEASRYVLQDSKVFAGARGGRYKQTDEMHRLTVKALKFHPDWEPGNGTYDTL